MTSAGSRRAVFFEHEDIFSKKSINNKQSPTTFQTQPKPKPKQPAKKNASSPLATVVLDLNTFSIFLKGNLIALITESKKKRSIYKYRTN
jgi:hypothetical protein